MKAFKRKCGTLFCMNCSESGEYDVNKKRVTVGPIVKPIVKPIAVRQPVAIPRENPPIKPVHSDQKKLEEEEEDQPPIKQVLRQSGDFLLDESIRGWKRIIIDVSPTKKNGNRSPTDSSDGDVRDNRINHSIEIIDSGNNQQPSTETSDDDPDSYLEMSRCLNQQTLGENRCRRIAEAFTGKLFPKTTLNFKDVTGKNVEIDCYCEELKLGIDYNGLQHHEYSLNSQEFVLDYTALSKIAACAENNVELITVSYKMERTEIEPYPKKKISERLRKNGKIIMLTKNTAL